MRILWRLNPTFRLCLPIVLETLSRSWATFSNSFVGRYCAEPKEVGFGLVLVPRFWPPPKSKKGKPPFPGSKGIPPSPNCGERSVLEFGCAYCALIQL